MKILFLDDMQTRHDAFRRNHIGHEVTHVETAQQAIHALSRTVFDIASLDHDLAEEHYLTMSQGESEDRMPGNPVYSPGTGMDVVDHIVTMSPKSRPRCVVIHSYNVARSGEMRDRLRDAGITSTCAQFSPKMVYREQ